MKNILFLLLCACSIVFPVRVQAQELLPIGTIVSQVRGFECCDPGDPSAFSGQIDTARKYQLPMTFALRFDALSDPQVTKELLEDRSGLFESALFLEITPDLAKAAGVQYRGTVTHWYQAQSAYLVGYTTEERKQMIDTAMEKFLAVFGRYPKSTVAWMIDTPTLSYLATAYGVVAHEITREQFSLDSYTLTGGNPSHPYNASSAFALIPSNTSTNMPLLFRQTVTDPLYTYGDITSTYTSQANDYLAGGRDLSYFSALLSSALFESQPYGFALIGLETSMPKNAQEEFGRQLEQVAKLRDEKKIQVLPISIAATLLRSAKDLLQKPTISTRSDERNQAVWITTNMYRVRLIKKERSVQITDLRVYDDVLQDPYAHEESKTAQAYWTVPALIDGSRTFQKKEKTKEKSVLVVANDFASQPDGLDLPPIVSGKSFEIHSSSLRYQSADGEVTFNFENDSFLVQFAKKSGADKFFFDISARTTDELLSFSPSILGNVVTVYPRVTTKAAANLPRTLMPIQVDGAVDEKKSIVEYSNRLAIANQNPIRVILRLRDSQNRPVVVDPSLIWVTTNGLQVRVSVQQTNETDGQYFLDFSSETSAKFTASVHIRDATVQTDTLRFAQVCQKENIFCLKDPVNGFWFLTTKIIDRLRDK